MDILNILCFNLIGFPAQIYISTVELIQISRYSLIYLKLKVAETPVAWKENIIPLAMN